MPFKVLIVGGSVAGLSLANMLEEFEIDYVLLEGYPDIAPQAGASIGLLPNGLRILDQLGCYEAYRSKAEDEVYQQAYLRDSNGKAYGHQHDLMAMWEKMLGYPMIFIDRQMLLQVLYDNLKDKTKVLTSQRVVSVDLTESGVTATTEDGKIYEADLVVGADGIHSTVRKEMWRNAPTGYFPANEDARVPAFTKCVFGISKRPKNYPKASQQSTLNSGYSYYCIAAPGNRVYWFLFVQFSVAKYGQDVSKFTKNDEEKLVTQHLDDQILENVKFRDLYENRIVSTFTPLQTYVFDKWHYQRIITIGDSAHKVDPVTGQGGNGAIESGAVLVNALLRKFDDCSSVLNQDDLESVLAQVRTSRFDRAQNAVEQGYWLQNAFTKRTIMGKFIARYLMPTLGTFGVLYRGVEFCAPSTSLERLRIPRRPHAVPFEDELPAKPLKKTNPICKIVSISFFTLISLVSAQLIQAPMELDLLINDLAPSGSDPALTMLLAVTYLTNWASLLSMALVESNRVGNQLSSLVFIGIFAVVNYFLWPGTMAPLACIFAHFTCSSIVGRYVTLDTARMVLPIVVLGYCIPALLALRSLEPQSIAIWRSAPLGCFLLARSLSASKDTRLETERSKFHNILVKSDVPLIRIIHLVAFAASATAWIVSVRYCGLGTSIVFGGKNAVLEALGFSVYDGFIFTLSLLMLSLGAGPWNLRMHGYITTLQAISHM
ncbi:unnamed protein product [Clonostachys rosea]|uniref:FAD-binding domain-containing protein n=1 Tax=Bionectria ochroleuca TaxID=29856 RepID=A0ABY6U8N0_BIOOC|nr:unnamed protein product [Clonostachys rosea]